MDNKNTKKKRYYVNNNKNMSISQLNTENIQKRTPIVPPKRQQVKKNNIIPNILAVNTARNDEQYDHPKRISNIKYNESKIQKRSEISTRKIAVLFFGNHYSEKWRSLTGFEYNLNFKHYEANIKKKLFEYFKKYTIDVFISSSKSSMSGEFVKAYNPVEHNFTSDPNNQRNWKIKNVLELLLSHIEKTKTCYELIIVTRPDIYFATNLSDVFIDHNKLNIVSRLQNTYLIDDNLYIFPQNYLVTFYYVSCRLYARNKNNTKYPNQGHVLLGPFRRHFNINYLRDEQCWVHKISFYKLRYFIDQPFIINTSDYTKGVLYDKNDASIIINDNKIEFRKIVKDVGTNAYIGFEIKNIGIHKVSVELTSSTDMNKNFFLSSDTESHNICVKKNKKTKIIININTTKKNEIIKFDCNKIPTKIFIVYENINITQ